MDTSPEQLLKMADHLSAEGAMWAEEAEEMLRTLAARETVDSKLKTLMAACKCGVYLSVNEHRDMYETAEQWFERLDEIGIPFDDLPPETRAEMIRLNTVIDLQFYPETPVGFSRVVHFDLDAALDEALGCLEGPIPQTLRSETEPILR